MRRDPLRVLQIGAGSMGTRRLRDLSARPDVSLAVLEARTDRRDRAMQRFGVTAFADLEAAISWNPDALIISTPPDQHEKYVHLALERGLHHFCEANIWTPDLDEIERVSA